MIIIMIPPGAVLRAASSRFASAGGGRFAPRVESVSGLVNPQRKRRAGQTFGSLQGYVVCF